MSSGPSSAVSWGPSRTTLWQRPSRLLEGRAAHCHLPIGHEPMHGGFVGRGMLDAACPGAVFTSPVPDQMLAATQAVNGGAGVLHIVKNYTGDVLNFEMAAELAQGEGVKVASVTMDDDVAVKDSLYTAGRRGVGATGLAEKITGAAAAAGAPLGHVADRCRKGNPNA